MFRFRATHVLAVTISVAVSFGAPHPTDAFNPQPEPPVERWRIEGFVDMTALEILPTSVAVPFGVDGAISDDNEVDFHAGIIATFAGADRDADGQPDNAVYAADLQYFEAQIGDTRWNETMPNSGLQVQVIDGLVADVSFWITETMPAHPDLQFMFSASPGAWQAVDERNDINVGTITGTYELRDGTVPEPQALLLLGLGLGGALPLARRRRR